MRKIIVLISIIFPVLSFSQSNSIGTFSPDETVFYAQTKQVNQFFRRFNGEESITGERNYDNSNDFRDPKVGKKFMNILFDNGGNSVTKELRGEFINSVLNRKNPVFLDFHGKDWYAEVTTVFTYKKEKVNIIVYLKLVKEKLGYKWVFSNVYFDPFEKMFAHAGDSTSNTLFIHPLSHEIDFMNLDKVFRDPSNIDYYLESHYNPDQLAMFTMAVKNGDLKYETVSGVKFHFFQIPGWYFEISYFNRNDVNSGWLIDNLVKINEKEKNDLIRHYTHDE